jgi:predicted adenylyl cyclase CyaB
MPAIKGINIELKARCSDPAAARQTALAIGARKLGAIDQHDTYFHVPTGRLKLREIDPQHSELICYTRANQAGSRPSKYLISPVSDPQSLKDVLSEALGVRAVVKKVREVFMWHNVRIHIDTVEGFGNFIEFEAVIGPKDSEADGYQRLDELCNAFGVKPDDQVPTGYVDMIA